MANENNLIPFSVDKSRINRNGRPKKIMTELQMALSKEGFDPIGKTEFISYLSVIIGLPTDKWDEVKKDSKTPHILKKVMESIEKDKNYKVIPDILDRIFGKAKEEFILNHKGENMNNLITPIQVIINGQIKE